ncbi:ATP-grasp domain-containing protein [Arhodomonas aquaeolei]|uniref:carboxylate--amine ligase n=2 Tax=Ectothiorhodospiraceae TaxID=72276 RepID=UPI000373747B|nr:ATP-grasp domain-containing protein [Arhodomonas aquaeolei]MCS4505807.1 ATP-grasp domain-containing protein [Arhodomonas aquaeolei]
MTYRVLVLDGAQRSALAVTRSLGRAGMHVITADDHPRTLSAASRYCAASRVYPAPGENPEAFVDAVAALVAEERVDVLLPVGDLTTALVLGGCERFAGVGLPCPPREAFETVTDKARLAVLAAERGVPVPSTRAFDTGAAALAASDSLSYPVVIKPARSQTAVGGQWLALPVVHAADAGELAAQLGAVPGYADVPVLVQQRLTGEGRGVFALYDRGRAVTFFAHRRLRERPPSGGVSVLSESVPAAPELVDAADRILSAVGWHGVAMAEFKLDAAGRAHLLEINGRFWGSLQLAVDAGVDFPLMACRLALGQDPAPPAGYRTGCRSRWLLGDLDSLYLRWRDGRRWARRGELAGAAARFLRLFERGTRYDVNRLEDLGPFLHECRYYLRGGAK